jgi:hypothetical protein
MDKLSQELFEKFLELSMRLSPENLSMDGELSRGQVQKRRKTIMAEWEQLEQEAGCVVTEDEITERFIASWPKPVNWTP